MKAFRIGNIFSYAKVRPKISKRCIFKKTNIFCETIRSETHATRRSGRVKWFDSTKGFGFIIPDDGSDDIFVHQTSIVTDGFRTLNDGETVEFELAYGEDGRQRAVQVTGPDGSDIQKDMGNKFQKFGGSRNASRIGESSGLQVVVHNLPWSCSWQRLEEVFSEFKPQQVDVIFDEYGRSKGFGIIKFASREDSMRAIEHMNEKELDGRTISVRFDRYG